MLIRLVSWLLLASSCLALRPVRAQPLPDGSSDGAVSSPYEHALEAALAAHARGEYTEARAFMERAHQLEPSARTLRGLGTVAYAQGRLAEAIRYLDEALASQEKPLTPALRANVEELLAHAWGQVGRYDVLLDPPDGELRVDGRLPERYAPRTLILMPGTHLLTFHARDRAAYDLTLSVDPGERRTLQLVLAAPAPAKSPGPPSAPTAAPGPAWRPALRWGLLGTGAALVAGGGALWGVAYGRLHGIVEDCRGRPYGVCTTEQAQREYRAKDIRALGISAAVSALSGAALLLAVAAVEIWHKTKGRRDQRELTVHTNGSSVWLRTRF